MTSIKEPEFQIMTDAKLVKAFNEGIDDARFDVFDRYYELLIRHIFHILKDAISSQDVLTQAFCEITEKGHISEQKPVKIQLYLAVQKFTLLAIKNRTDVSMGLLTTRKKKSHRKDNPLKDHPEKDLVNTIENSAKYLTREQKATLKRFNQINLPDYQKYAAIAYPEATIEVEISPNWYSLN